VFEARFAARYLALSLSRSIMVSVTMHLIGVHDMTKMDYITQLFSGVLLTQWGGLQGLGSLYHEQSTTISRCAARGPPALLFRLFR
jgi:hypothetical protein